MKILITEQQFNVLCEQMIFESMFYRGMTYHELIEAVKKLARRGLLTASIIANIVMTFKLNDAQKNELTQAAKEETQQVQQVKNNGKRMEKDWKKDPNFKAKVDAVYDFMLKSTSVFGKRPEDIPISAENIVKECEKTGYDIPLLLAQGHWESHFGANPKAKRCQQTKSIFSVGLWDNGDNRVKYDTFDESVPAYIKLMQNDYFKDGKSVKELLAPGGFTNFDNKRYAQKSDYEQDLTATRNKILRNYPILGI